MRGRPPERSLLPLCLWLILIAGCLELPSSTEYHGGQRSTSSHGKVVSESARGIPVLYDVDVVVVGGGTGAVAAAAAAAERGANVFLAAPRPYLGEDVCGTYRFWLEPGEAPTSDLAKAVFAEPEMTTQFRNALSFAYEADIQSSAPHKDAQPPKMLNDGKWHSAPSQSVQYNGDVAIIADLGAAQAVEKAHVMVYQRNGDFEIADVTVSASSDKQQWHDSSTVENHRLGQGSFEQAAIVLSAPVGKTARYLRFVVHKSADVKRVLLGEIIIEGPSGRATAPPARVPPTPMQVKRALDDALLDAGVEFLYGCYATDVLQDGAGKPGGIVMVNRSGRQAVRARVIIDATARATVARMTGARFDLYPAGIREFKRIVVAGEVRDGEHIRARKLPTPVWAAAGRAYKAIEYTLAIPMPNGSTASFAQAEQIARDRTWHPGQVDASETLFQVPPDRMKGKAKRYSEWPGADKIDLDVFRPAGVARLYVLGGCADLPRRAAEKLLRPLSLMDVGARIGTAAAAEAATIGSLGNVGLAAQIAEPVTAGDVREDSAWMRVREETARIEAGPRALPVLGEYDVVVVGGGTGGAPAGIAAARQGAKTLVVEYLHGLGGIGTLGLIGSYYHGHREGFTKELDQGLAQLGGEAEGRSGQGQAWNSQLKIEWYRQELRKAGADLWYGTLGCGAFVDGNRVKGVVVATPQGRGVVLAKTVIDATGKAAIAAAAGAQCLYTTDEHIAIQGTGLPPWEPGARYTNTDYTFIDDLDVTDTWRAFLVGRKKFKEAYDLAQIVDSRERRQIVGDFFLTPMDVYLDRTFPDSVVRANSNFDSHGFTVHPMFMVRPPDRKSLPCYVPYRCLLPQGLDGILATGLAVSAHRDVMPVIRMQPDIQNQGYAAGVAAATAARSGQTLRDIDIRQLQRHLVQKGNLPEEVLTQEDSLPLSAERVEQAVQCVVNDFQDLEIIFAQAEQALPLLREAYETADSEQDKLTYAHILGIMGDPTGTDTLVRTVQASGWDEGWKYTGMGQFGRSISAVDGLIIALGRTRQEKALAPILAKVERLGPEDPMSHHRAVAVALESLADPAAAQPLAELLQKPEMTGHAYTDIGTMTSDIPRSATDNTTRERSLRELILARALYRCGDYQGLGERVLKEYSTDLRGHYARHALAVLGEKR